MTTQLNDKESEKLFAQMSNAIRNQEFDKIDELATSPETEDTQTVVKHEELPPADTTDVGGNDVQPPAEKQPEPDGVEVETQTEEKTEQDKLAEALALIEKVQKENHNLRSQMGRVPHLQRQIQQIDKKLEELTSPSSRPSTKLTEKFTQKLAKIKEVDPELADTLADVLVDATDGVATDLRDAEAQSLQNQRRAMEQEIRDAEVSRLLEMYPNAQEVFQSPSWKSWEGQQSKQLQALANSDNADDVAFAFEKYAADMLKAHPELAAPARTENTEAAKIEAERQRKLQTSVVVGTPGPAGRQQKPENDEALFRQYSEQIRKEITGK